MCTYMSTHIYSTCEVWLCAHDLVCCLSAQCIVFTYMCTCNIYVHEYTHIIYIRIVAMRAQPGLILMYTMYCIYIIVYI